MVSYAGGSSIFANGSSRSSASRSPSRPWAENFGPWAIASSPLARVTMRKPREPSRNIKKLPRAWTRSRAIWFFRRSAHRAEEQDHAALGQTRHTAFRAKRSAHGLDLYLWRNL